MTRVVGFLEDYCAHFQLEEKWMEETRESSAFREQIQTTGPTTALVITTSTRISQWLRTHIASGPGTEGDPARGKEDRMKTRTRRTARLGDLVAAVFDEAARYTTDAREVSRLATRAVRHLLQRQVART